MNAYGKKMACVELPVSLIHRVDSYLESPVAIVKSKRKLFEKSLMDFLDREEIIASEMEKELARIREIIR